MSIIDINKFDMSIIDINILWKIQKVNERQKLTGRKAKPSIASPRHGLVASLLSKVLLHFAAGNSLYTPN